MNRIIINIEYREKKHLLIILGNSNSSAGDSDFERVDVLPSMDDNAQIDANEGNVELVSDMDSDSDDVDMLPVTDENAMDYRGHLSESVDTIHLTGKQFDSNGDYYLENDGVCKNLFGMDIHSQHGKYSSGSGSWYAQAEKDPSYMDERSNFITLESFSHPTDDDDDDDNSGDDQASDGKYFQK